MGTIATGQAFIGEFVDTALTLAAVAVHGEIGVGAGRLTCAEWLNRDVGEKRPLREPGYSLPIPTGNEPTAPLSCSNLCLLHTTSAGYAARVRRKQ